MNEKKFLNRTITLTLPLNETAKVFGYKLDVDSFNDVFHNGYSIKDVRKMDLRLPAELEDVNKIFPNSVAFAMEDAEREAYAEAIRNEKVSAFTEALEKINLSSGGAEYQDLDGDLVSAKAGIISATVDEASDTVTIEILNPEHLINTVIHGMGYFASDLSSTEPATDKEIKQRFHNLNYYFDIYGDSKPKGELSSQFYPNINEDFFAEQIKFRIEELSIAEIADAVMDAVESETMEAEDALNQASKLSKSAKEEIKKEIIQKVKEEVDFWKKVL